MDVAVSRRSFITSAVSGAALAALSTTGLDTALASAAYAAGPMEAKASNPNLVLGKYASASSLQPGLPAWNVLDGNPMSYWESADYVLPQWFQVDLVWPVSVSRVVLKLPPLPAWQTRTQTLTVQGNLRGYPFPTLAGSPGYIFNPATGNTVTITFPPTPLCYIRLNFTANTAWPAAQLAELEAYTT